MGKTRGRGRDVVHVRPFATVPLPAPLAWGLPRRGRCRPASPAPSGQQGGRAPTRAAQPTPPNPTGRRPISGRGAPGVPWSKCQRRRASRAVGRVPMACSSAAPLFPRAPRACGEGRGRLPCRWACSVTRDPVPFVKVRPPPAYAGRRGGRRARQSWYCQRRDGTRFGAGVSPGPACRSRPSGQTSSGAMQASSRIMRL